MRWSIVPGVDGVHDMGGMQGFGPANWPGADAPYHEQWEARALALNLITGFERIRVSNGRALREEMPPAEYLAAGYFDRWIWSTEHGVLDNGKIAPGEMEAMMARLAAGEPMPARSDPAQVERVLHAIANADQLPPAVDPRYAVGDRVRVKRMRPDGHNRCPRYLRGAEGVVERIHCNDRRPGAGPSRSHAVAFTGAELWGEDAERSSVVADLWEGYLEPAS